MFPLTACCCLVPQMDATKMAAALGQLGCQTKAGKVKVGLGQEQGRRGT